MQVVIQKSHLPHKKLEAVIDGKKTVPFGQKKKRMISLFIKILKEKHDISIDIKEWMKIGQNLVSIQLACILNIFCGIKKQFKSQSMIWRNI